MTGRDLRWYYILEDRPQYADPPALGYVADRFTRGIEIRIRVSIVIMYDPN